MPLNVDIPVTKRVSSSKSFIFAFPNTSSNSVGFVVPIPTLPGFKSEFALNTVPPIPTFRKSLTSKSGNDKPWLKVTWLVNVAIPVIERLDELISGTDKDPLISTSFRKVTFSLNCASLPVTDIFDIF